MAYVNVRDWSVEQVTDWLKGLDSVIAPYTKSFLNNEVKGHQLLSLRSDDLEHLGVLILGHQEVILEAVEHLRNFHYKLDKENLQTLALRLSCAANSLCKELSLTDENCTMVPTQTMSDVHNIITAIKPLVCWLDRSPFRGNKDYVDCKTQLLQLSFEMATSAHRDIFSEKPLRTIRSISDTLAKLADHIIQEMTDPMILQPASLALATLKKKEQELGFFLLPSYYPIHQIAEIKYGSPAHNSSKIEEGDEIVQVNYQTVVGWQRKNVLLLLQESPPEIVLTLKKRPRHTKVYGQIYMKPYRLPSKKRATPYSRWNDNLPSPQLLAIHDLPQIPPPRLPPVIAQPETETEISSSSDSEPLDSPLDGGGRVYPLKPRPVLQRRNTITGASPTSKRPHQAIEQYWQQLKNQAASKHSSSYNIQSNKYEDESTLLRDKSVSCSNGFELAPRPTTVIGISQSKGSTGGDFKRQYQDKSFRKKKVNFDESKSTYSEASSSTPNICTIETKIKTDNDKPQTNLNEEHSVSVNSLTSLNESIDFIDEAEDITDRSNMKQIVEEIVEAINETVKTVAPPPPPSPPPLPQTKDSAFADVHVLNIIKKFDEKHTDNSVNIWDPSAVVKPKVFPKNVVEKPPELPQKSEQVRKPVVPPKNIRTKLRGTLSKSHSTPAYDQSPDVSLDNIKIPENVSTPEIQKPLMRDLDEARNFISYNKPIKYELGIPIVDSSAPSAPIYLPERTDKNLENISVSQKKEPQDIPPKPPPRLSCTTNKSVTESPKSSVPHETIKDLSLRSLESPKSPNDALYSCNTSADPVVLLKSPDVPLELSHKSVKSNENVDYFEPKNVSTPITKTCKMEFPEVEINYARTASNLESIKVSSDNKVSPTNSVVRAMIYSNKNKNGKKKNALIAKRRKVSVKDVAPGELQGFLYQRLRCKQSQTVSWEKRWFVLNGSCLYGFKSKDAQKADCLIFLSGFTVSIATEVKSRSNAFKVYHTGTVFYFSAEDSEMLMSWIELITAATLLYDNSKPADSSLYSETDESDSEKPKPPPSDRNNSEPPIRKFGSLKKSSSSSAENGSSSLDRKWFFHKTNSIYKNAMPVPTAQFRSYRKIPSSNINVIGSISTGNFTSHIPDFSPRFEANSQSQTSLTSLPPEIPKPQKSDLSMTTKPPKVKHKPLNYVHASNPNLCDISDFHLRNFNKLQPFQPCTDNLAGFVTLEELMNRQSEEQKLNPHAINDNAAYNPNFIRADVVYGEVPIRPNKESEKETKNRPKKPTHSRTVSDCSECVSTSSTSSKVESKHSNDSSTSFCFGKRGSLKKHHKKEKDAYDVFTFPKLKGPDDKLNRSLPRMHKLQEDNTNPRKQSRRHSGERKPFSTKEYSVSYVDLKDQSCEMVSCPQTQNNDVHFAQNRTLDGKMSRISKITRQHSLTSVDKKEIKTYTYGTSSERMWIESLRKHDKVADKNSTNVKLKSAIQYTPMTLPLAPDQKGKLNPKFAFELNLDEKVSKSGKFKNFFKPAEGKREKGFLGSPKLRRAVFEKHNRVADTNPLRWPDSVQLPAHRTLEACYSAENATAMVHRELPSMQAAPSIDYPGLEYPPVFEPETYSLSDPQSSISLLRKDKNN